MKAPRVTGIPSRASGGRTHACPQACVYTKSRSVAFGAGVSTYGAAIRVVWESRTVGFRSENPEGFGMMNADFYLFILGLYRKTHKTLCLIAV